MTEKLAVIDAEFVAFRTVGGRKVLQLQLEVPIERSKEVLEKLGTPVGGSSLWVAVALLDREKARKPAAAQVSEANGSNNPRKFSELPYSQQAAIRCGEPAFRAFLLHRYKATAENHPDPAEAVRLLCGVTSRAELDVGDTGAVWVELEKQYQSYLTDQRFGGAKR